MATKPLYCGKNKLRKIEGKMDLEEKLKEKIKCFSMRAKPLSDYLKETKENSDHNYQCHSFGNNCEYQLSGKPIYICTLDKYLRLEEK
jgi:hypothetical protein